MKYTEEIWTKRRFTRWNREAILLSIILVTGCESSRAPAPPTEAVESTASREATAGSTSPTSPTKTVRPASHRRMLALLQDVERRTNDEHFFLGDRLARGLREAVSTLPDSAPAAQRWELSHKLGVVELRVGNVAAAIESFSRAHELIAAAGLNDLWANKTRFDLAVAYLRRGEVENCCSRNTPESCLLPIRGGGVHVRESGSREAMRYLSSVLAHPTPDEDLLKTARWLLNIAAMTLGTYPDGVPERFRVSPTVFEPPFPFPRFRNVAAALGLDTVSLSGGAIADDFDGDGDLDLLVSTWDTSGPMRFFRNGGDGTFLEHTEQAGLVGLLGGLNMKHADYDNDGDLDVLVLRGAWLGDKGRHPNSLLQNDGKAFFTDVTFAAGLGDDHFPTQTAAWGDYDNDGDLDLYVGNETTPRLAAPCQLFRNEGDGTFVDVASDAGVTNDRYSKGVCWGDYDEDRDLDLYVSNLDGPNRLFRNEGDGTFVDVAGELGVTEPRSSFPVWFWDYNNDGHLDLFVTSYAGRIEEVAAYYLGEEVDDGLPRLYRGDGKGGFEDVTRSADLRHPILAMGSNFGDLDGDGFLDFYLGTGDPEYVSLMPNLMFLNRGGSRFVNVSFAGGFGHLQKGHSVAFADLDHDGDLDVFEQMGGAYRGDAFGDALYENPGFGRRWLCVKLVGSGSNRCALDARIRVEIEEGGGSRLIFRHVTSGGSFGGNPLRQTIGLGNAERIVTLEVYWPTTGTTQRFEGIPLDRGIEVREGNDQWRALPLAPFRLATDASPPTKDESAAKGRSR